MERSHVKSVHLSFPAPFYAEQYRRIFQCPVALQSNWNALVLEKDAADRAIMRKESYALLSALKYAVSLLVDLEEGDGLI